MRQRPVNVSMNKIQMKDIIENSLSRSREGEGPSGINRPEVETTK